MPMVMMMMTALACVYEQACMPVAYEIQYVRFDQEFYWIWLLYYEPHTNTHSHRPDGHDSTQSHHFNFQLTLALNNTMRNVLLCDSCVCNKPTTLNTKWAAAVAVDTWRKIDIVMGAFWIVAHWKFILHVFSLFFHILEFCLCNPTVIERKKCVYEWFEYFSAFCTHTHKHIHGYYSIWLLLFAQCMRSPKREKKNTM